jgi:hypothetical protein
MRRLGVKRIAGLGAVHTMSNITTFELFFMTKVSPWFTVSILVRC